MPAPNAARQNSKGLTWAQKLSLEAGGGGFTKQARLSGNYAAAGPVNLDNPFGDDFPSQANIESPAAISARASKADSRWLRVGHRVADSKNEDTFCSMPEPQQSTAIRKSPMSSKFTKQSSLPVCYMDRFGKQSSGSSWAKNAIKESNARDSVCAEKIPRSAGSSRPQVSSTATEKCSSLVVITPTTAQLTGGKHAAEYAAMLNEIDTAISDLELKAENLVGKQRDAREKQENYSEVDQLNDFLADLGI